MDFIEKIFGISPDGGSGALEFLLLAVPLLGLGYLAFAAGNSRRRRSRRGQ
jgi:hypothetical protein